MNVDTRPTTPTVIELQNNALITKAIIIATYSKTSAIVTSIYLGPEKVEKSLLCARRSLL